MISARLSVSDNEILAKVIIAHHLHYPDSALKAEQVLRALQGYFGLDRGFAVGLRRDMEAERRLDSAGRKRQGEKRKGYRQ